MGIVIKKEQVKDFNKMHEVTNLAWKDIISIYQQVPQTDKEWKEWIDHLNTYCQPEEGVSEEVNEFSRKMANLLSEHCEKLYKKEIKKQNTPK